VIASLAWTDSSEEFSRTLDGGVCSAAGFKAAGLAAGIKPAGKLDLALIWSDDPCSCAGVFTQNLACAAPVTLSKARVASGGSNGVIVNSGCANACTGERGMQDALAMSAHAAAALKVEPQAMLVCSTGLIGSFLPMDKIANGAKLLAQSLSSDDKEAAEAIMTTDTRPKKAAFQHRDGWRIGGIAKGAGMIAPNMATMLAFITTDAQVQAGELQLALNATVPSTFNAITIDGDTSTNDTVLVFGNGASGKRPARNELEVGLGLVCMSLARQIVEDAEGASKLVMFTVEGAADDQQATLAARTVAESILVKTAMAGQDANWGRVAAALGRSGTQFRLDDLLITMAGVVVFGRGAPVGPDVLAQARAGLAAREIYIVCDLGAGSGSAQVLTADLTENYVSLNTEYEL